MKKRIAAALGTLGATTLLLLAFATPSQAATQWHYWVTATDVRASEFPFTCMNDNEHYGFAWHHDGDKVFLIDCAANGWGTKIRVRYRNAADTGWLTAGTLHDPSAPGDGGTKSFATIVPENRKIRLESWEYQGDNLANYVVCTGLHSSADRHASCTDPVD